MRIERNQTILEDITPLNESYEPDELPEREAQIDDFQEVWQKLINRQGPSNMFVYGKVGTGKTITTRHMLSVLQENVERYEDIDLTTLWVTCEGIKSSYQAQIAIINEIREKLGTGDRISSTGHAHRDIIKHLYNELDEIGGTIYIILDEIDNIGHSDEILYGLPRARVNGHVDNVEIGVIGISNDLKFYDNLRPKVKDTLAEQEILFPPYDADQLRSILEPRAERAFFDGVLSEAVIPLCAAFASQDSGSARQAIRLLRESGEIAQVRGEEQVTEEHVQTAQERIERNQIEAGMRQLTTQGQAALSTIAYFEADSNTPIRIRDLYARYKQLCTQLDLEPISERRVRDHLNDLSMLGIARSYEVNEGSTGGRYYEYELDISLDAVVDALSADNRFTDLAKAIEKTAEKNGTLQRNLNDY